MAVCRECGKKLSFFGRIEEKCPECMLAFDQYGSLARERQDAEEAEAIRNNAETENAISGIVLTTESGTSLEIIERIEIITAECAYGMNIFKDLFAGVRDIVGGRSKAVEKTMRDARRTALLELKREAHAVGANAVVGVDLDYIELSGAGSMVMLVASGTSVRAKL